MNLQPQAKYANIATFSIGKYATNERKQMHSNTHYSLLHFI